MLKWLYNLWQWLLKRLLATKPARLAVLMVLAVLVFLIVSEQGVDVVRALAERQEGAKDEWQRIFFYAGVLAWSVYAWYWARVMLRLAFRGVPGNDPDLLFYRTWMPRVLGTLAALGVSAALFVAAQGYSEELPAQAEVRERLLDHALWCLAGAAAFFVAVIVRRPLLRMVYGGLSAVTPQAAQGAVNLIRVNATREEQYGTADLNSLGKGTLIMLAGAILAEVLLLLLFVFAVQTAAPAFGTAAILLFAATGWIAAGSTLDFIGMRLRVPMFIGLFVLAVLFSALNDNHAVRTLDESQPADRPDLRTALREWLAHQPAETERYALYLVNAEGGGIRAAWWTARVLAEIQDKVPQFGQRLFSLSGVSGGSLGASVFAATLAEQRAGRALDVKRTARDVLGEDFLAPAVAAMLYPDLLQRLLPFPVPHFDRALALEEAWERAWGVHVPGRNRLAESMDHLREGAVWAPLLYLNATWVETGKRIIASHARIESADGSVDFVDTEDAQGFFAPRSLRLSTAAHLSARFTYLSPAGTLKRDGTTHGRVVDGGYFENSAATTSLEIAKTINAMAGDPTEDPRWEEVDVLVIHISNEPVDSRNPPETLEHAAGHRKIGPGRWMSELLSPLRTMLRTREARGTYARETLQLHVGGDNFFHFGLCRERSRVPLGWVLSESTRNNMEAQLGGAPCVTRDAPARVLFDNGRNLERLSQRGE